VAGPVNAYLVASANCGEFFVGVSADCSGVSADRSAVGAYAAGVRAYGAGVSAYAVRVSAYGVSSRQTYRPRQRLRLGQGRSARSGGSHSVGLRAPRGYVQPAIDVAHFEHLIAQNDLLPNSRA
jgi:hypothetical protein